MDADFVSDRKWDEDKYRFENRVDYDKDRLENRVDYDENRTENRVEYDKNRVEDFPDDAAQWGMFHGFLPSCTPPHKQLLILYTGGRKVQQVEDIPQDIENKWDNAVDDVEDAPDRVADFFGREEGRVDRFDDGIQNSFDQGRDEERYDDNNDDY